MQAGLGKRRVAEAAQVAEAAGVAAAAQVAQAAQAAQPPAAAPPVAAHAPAQGAGLQMGGGLHAAALPSWLVRQAQAGRASDDLPVASPLAVGEPSGLRCSFCRTMRYVREGSYGKFSR